MEKRQESALMAFVLFNITDEIVKREKTGIAYQEGNNRVCVLFQTKWSRSFDGKIKSICHEIQTEIKKVMGTDVSMAIGKWVKISKTSVPLMIWQSRRFSTVTFREAAF